MTDHQPNPSELADHLDNVIPPGRNNPILADQDPSVDAALRLAKAPYLTLAADKKAQILTQVLAAHQQSLPIRRPYRLPPRTPLLLTVVSGLIVSVAVLLFIIIPALDSTSGDQGDEQLVDPLTITPVNTLTRTPVPATVVPTGVPGEQVTVPLPTSTTTPSTTIELTMPPTEVPSEEVTAAPPTSTPVPSATTEPTMVPIETAAVEIPPEITALVQPEVTEEPDEDIDTAEIVIVGPVSEIRDNVIVIYDFEFVLDPDHPLLTAILVDDVLRIEGDIEEQDGSFVIITIEVTVISTDIYIGDDGSVWRDSDNCQNPPPPQAPAHGWRERCEGGGGQSSGS